MKKKPDIDWTGWRPCSVSKQAALVHQLKREMKLDHPLCRHADRLGVIAADEATDDVLVLCSDNRDVAFVVHLTWAIPVDNEQQFPFCCPFNKNDVPPHLLPENQSSVTD